MHQQASLACPHCGEPLLDYVFEYSNHGVRVTANTIETHHGFVRASPTMRAVMVLLLEAHPNVVRHRSLCMLYEDLDSTRGGDAATILKVLFSKNNDALESIGIAIVNVWGEGYRLRLGK